jgi:hypothetical protein
MGQIENKSKMFQSKSNIINHHIKFKWSQCFNLKGEVEKMND